jgi:predicted ATPase/DNA-binding CsgD family transcriptional regulator
MSMPNVAGTAGVPAAGHGFVGRGAELERIVALLRGGRVRLVTLVGPGGIGKTRLAVEAVRRVRVEGGLRVYWVRLARLGADADYAAVERATVSAVVGPDFSGRSSWEALTATLDRPDSPPAVVCFDNVEHVLDAVRHLIAELLDARPGLTVLATGRGTVGWIDECPITVPPLPDREALTLFRARAALAGHPLVGDGENTVAAAVCRHLHNNPLNIVLAAGRLRRRVLAQILDSLTGRADDGRMGWSGPRAGVDPRHRAVTDVIDWSYTLCTAPERLLFDRLSVFAAGHDSHPDDRGGGAAMTGADLAAIEAVCADDDADEGDGGGGDRLSGHEVAELLDGLVDQSLATVHRTSTTVRFSLLESLRVFAAARLRDRAAATVDESARLAQRHLHYYRCMVADAAARWFGPDEQSLLDWARAAWDNILVAVDTSLTARGDAAAGLEICVKLIDLRVPFVRGSLRDIGHITERCLDATRAMAVQPVGLQIAAEAALCWLTVRQGRSHDARRLLDTCVAACLPGTDTTGWRRRGSDLGLPAGLDLAWGTVEFMDECNPRSVGILVRARDKFHRVGDAGNAMLAGMFAGLASGLLGTREQARAIAGRCLAEARAAGAPGATSWAQLSWALALIKDADPVEAARVLREALTCQLAVGDQWGAAWAVELRTWALAHIITSDSSDPTTTARDLAGEIALLAGGLDTLRSRRLGVDLSAMGAFAVQSRHARRVARRVLDQAYPAVYARGTGLHPDAGEVHRLALGELTLDPVHDDPAATTPYYGLGRAEKDVAYLAAAGYNNPEIARRRGKSTRTVENQIQAIMRKLDVPSRDGILDHLPADLKAEAETENAEAEAKAGNRDRPTPAGERSGDVA